MQSDDLPSFPTDAISVFNHPNAIKDRADEHHRTTEGCCWNFGCHDCHAMTTIITEEWISLIQAVHIVVIKVEMEDREAMEDPLEMFLFLVLLLGY